MSGHMRRRSRLQLPSSITSLYNRPPLRTEPTPPDHATDDVVSLRSSSPETICDATDVVEERPPSPSAEMVSSPRPTAPLTTLSVLQHLMTDRPGSVRSSGFCAASIDRNSCASETEEDSSQALFGRTDVAIFSCVIEGKVFFSFFASRVTNPCTTFWLPLWETKPVENNLGCVVSPNKKRRRSMKYTRLP